MRDTWLALVMVYVMTMAMVQSKKMTVEMMNGIMLFSVIFNKFDTLLKKWAVYQHEYTQIYQSCK